MLITLGYHPKGELGVSGRRYFEKGGDQRTHHVHVFQEGSPDIERHLAFRAYLCAHPADAKRYSVSEGTLYNTNQLTIVDAGLYNQDAILY